MTVDAQRLGKREADERNRFTLPTHLQLKNLQLLSQADTAQARDSQVKGGVSTSPGRRVMRLHVILMISEEVTRNQ